MPAPTTIRSATLNDIEAAAALGAEIVRLHHAVDPKRFFILDNIEQGYAWWLKQEIERPEAVVMVAEREGEIVGYGYGAIEDRDWSILIDRHAAVHDVCVAPAVRRQGVARALVTAIITRLEELGAPLIVLRTMVQNDPARRLAETLGFRATMLEMTRESAQSGRTR